VSFFDAFFNAARLSHSSRGFLLRNRIGSLQGAEHTISSLALGLAELAKEIDEELLAGVERRCEHIRQQFIWPAFERAGKSQKPVNGQLRLAFLQFVDLRAGRRGEDALAQLLHRQPASLAHLGNQVFSIRGFEPAPRHRRIVSQTDTIKPRLFLTDRA
jgi:hypothetical protein